MPNPTNEELQAQIKELGEKYQKALGLDSWQFQAVIADAPQGIGTTNISSDAAASMRPLFEKRIARITIRECEARRDDGAILPYLIAHEIAHIFFQGLGHVIDEALGSCYLSEAYREIYDDEWISQEEALAHRLGILLSGVTPPVEFWMDELKDKSCRRQKS